MPTAKAQTATATAIMRRWVESKVISWASTWMPRTSLIGVCVDL
jgi:hypothetical protein